MKIVNSAVLLDGESQKSNLKITKEKTEITGIPPRSAFDLLSGIKFELSSPNTDKIKAEITDKAIQRLAQTNSGVSSLNIAQNVTPATDSINLSVDKSADLMDSMTEMDKQKLRMLDNLIYALTGKRMKFKIPQTDKNAQENGSARSNIVTATPAAISDTAPARTMPTPPYWKIAYRQYEKIETKEKMSFSASGSVETANGKTFKFNLEVNASREIVNEKHLSATIEGGKQIDPLILNLGHNM